ncbi:protein of unknown function [Candidatus Filomicrobium marinum]|uniref:Uncharacterized protein n=1 Tax=Candidatus Filomicrobium marinum TaxID=1608628 RepID=A0A0D6JE82_9HYPH|nr:protein of unknown function [Candidatus Filomicrobium marinum]CPR18260.1 protein of unknown function [Candidatus Filomicrobium marinum]
MIASRTSSWRYRISRTNASVAKVRQPRKLPVHLSAICLAEAAQLVVIALKTTKDPHILPCWSSDPYGCALKGPAPRASL